MKTITVFSKDGQPVQVTIYDKMFTARTILAREARIVDYLKVAGFRDTKSTTEHALRIAKIYATVELVCPEVDTGKFPGLEAVLALSPLEKAAIILDNLPLESAIKIWTEYFEQFKDKETEVEEAKNF